MVLHVIAILEWLVITPYIPAHLMKFYFADIALCIKLTNLMYTACYLQETYQFHELAGVM